MYAESLNDENPRMTEATYLAFADEQLDMKYEYSSGAVYAMSGGTVRHGAITASTIIHIGNELRHDDCTVTNSDVRVYIASKKAYRYPDVTVFCGDPAYREGRADTLTNPMLLVEVLSPSTALTDRNEKLAEYTQIDSLQAYVLVAQDEPKVEVFQRHEAGRWLYSYVTGMDAKIVVSRSGTDLHLSLAEIYRRVRWDEDTPSDDKPSVADENSA
ncbi:MAG: Uma2 family endonuclease [Chloroflexota bacterium]